MQKRERMSSNTRMKTKKAIVNRLKEGKERKTGNKQPGEEEGTCTSEGEEQLRVGRCNRESEEAGVEGTVS